MESLDNLTVRAIDLGYGYTKYVKQVTDVGDIIIDSFPSLAVPTSISSAEKSARNTVVIDVHGQQYEVGQDVYQASVLGASKSFNSTFEISFPYDAMLRAALHFMNIKTLDLLVLGLPVSVFDSKEIGSYLENKYTGTVELTPGCFIEISKVWILPQPAGGMFYYGSTNDSYARIDKKINLLVDAGYYSFQWYSIEGVARRLATFGSTSGGVSGYLRGLANEISNDTGIKLKDLQRLDNALLKSEPVTLCGKPISLEKYKKGAMKSIERNVDKMKSKVGDGAHIDNIIIVGGGGSLFYPEIKKRFPHHDIQTLEDGVFANIKGFQISGEMYISS